MGASGELKLGDHGYWAGGPPASAMAAMTLDLLSGGRVILGLGVSGPQVVEVWYGQPFEKPLARTREYKATARAASSRA